MNTHTSRTRKLRYATLSAVVAGAGTGSAVAISTVPTTDPTTGTTVTAERGNLWAVVNFTDRTLTAGEFYRQQGDRTFTIMFGNGEAWCARTRRHRRREATRGLLVSLAHLHPGACVL